LRYNLHIKSDGAFDGKDKAMTIFFLPGYASIKAGYYVENANGCVLFRGDTLAQAQAFVSRHDGLCQ
jgi:hypothetical protein